MWKELGFLTHSLTGFHNSIRIWRGYFTGNATGAILSVQGGDAL